MAVTRTQAISRIRNRLRDTKTEYHFSTDLITEMLEPSLREMETEIRQVDPDYFIARFNVRGFTDALDPNPSDPSNGYQKYALPPDFAGMKWIERGDGSWHYKIPVLISSVQENARFRSVIAGTMTFDGTTTYSVPVTGGTETASIEGDRFNIIPPPGAAGPIYTVVYERRVKIPEGDSEELDVPPIFEESLILSTAVRCARLDNEPLAETLATMLYGNERERGELQRARASQAKRTKHETIAGRWM